MATAQDLIDAALRKIGTSIPDSTDRANGLIALNDMISSWSIDNLLVYAVTQESFTLTIGTYSYTIGSSGDYDTVRPIKITNAYLRDSDGYDYPLDIISSKEYNDIADKDVSSRPTRLYYLPAFPLAKILFDYAPDAADTLYLDSQKHLSEFAALTTDFSMPPEYRRALIYNLAVDLAPEYDWVLTQEATRIAYESKDLLMDAKSIASVTPEVVFDDAITQGGKANINTNEI